MQMLGKVKEIYISMDTFPSPVLKKENVELVKNKGIVGDRYFYEKGYWSTVIPKTSLKRLALAVTLTSTERLEECRSELGITLTPEMIRRNIITEGIDLNNLIGKFFSIGNDVELLCTIPNYPCPKLEEYLSMEGLRSKFKEKNWILGINCIIYKGGKINIGDNISPIQNLTTDHLHKINLLNNFKDDEK